MPSKSYYQKHKAHYLEQAKIQRQTPEYKLLKKKYRESAKGKLKAKLHNQKWSQENHDKIIVGNLGELYVIMMLYMIF